MNKQSLRPDAGKSGRYILSLVMAAAGVIIALLKPFGGLDGSGHIMLGSVTAALAMWMFRPGGGTFAAGAAVIFLGGSFAGVPMSVLASGFSSSSLWLLIPAMFLGYTLLKTGLGRRMVFALFKRLNLTYIKILAGWLVIGVVFSLLTPSITVRFLILTPIAVSVADACLLPKRSKGRSLIVISAWAVSIFPGISWLNGSLYGPVFSSYLPLGAMRDMATEQMWLKAMGIPWMLMSVAFLAVLYLVLRPESKLTVTKEQLKIMYDELGETSRDEKICLCGFALLIIFLVCQSFLPITTNQVLFGVFILLLFTGVISVKEISQGISWDTVIFFGMILSFSGIFEVSGITAWLSPLLASLLKPIASSPLVFVLALYGICVILRFMDVAQGWIISAVLAMATPMLFGDFGIHPLVCIMVFLCAANLFFFRYHQPWVGQVEAVCGESGWDSHHLLTASVCYAVLAAILLVFCRFYWQIAGIL